MSQAQVLFLKLSGKDNEVGKIGKIILDKIKSGEWIRNVNPYKPPLGVDVQRFTELRDECLRNKSLFEDPAFPAADSSLHFSTEFLRRVTWLRPGQIVDAPLLFSEGHSRFDVNQGDLGDCWLLSAMVCLTLNDALFYRVVPPDQSFTKDYAGIFHFQFWRYGKWIDVVIDDRLPTENGQLLYTHSVNNLDFWSALLEKAYAKLNGSYEALKGGTASEALEDFTGGLTEIIDLKFQPSSLVQTMFRAFELEALMGASIAAGPNESGTILPNGLIRGHEYSITGMKLIDGIPLLRIRNPWGDDHVWNGAWSNNSVERKRISEEDKKLLAIAHNGETWMSFDDFTKNFSVLEICNLGPEVMEEMYQMTGVRETKDNWKTCQEDGEWKCLSAGGCRNFSATFANNPQYGITLSNINTADGLCACIFAVMQKHRREERCQMLTIGFSIYKVDNIARQSFDFFAQNQPVATCAVYLNTRQVCARCRLSEGKYIMIPTTFEPGQDGLFMIRIFSQVGITLQGASKAIFWILLYLDLLTSVVLFESSQRVNFHWQIFNIKLRLERGFRRCVICCVNRRQAVS